MSCDLINPRKDFPRVFRQMYRALQSKPCACGKRVGPDSRISFVQCGGCAAMAAYELIADVVACE